MATEICTMCETAPATTVYGLPVCDACKAMLDETDAMLKEMEAEDPALAELGRRVEEGCRALLSKIIPCDWGREIGLPEDMTPCAEVAERNVVIHDPVNSSFELQLRLCPKHDAIVKDHTNTRTDPCAG